TLFKIPVFGWILKSMNSIPVVRKMDAAGEVDYSVFFSSCVEALAEGSCLAIFPEGRSLPRPLLAPLRTGPARLFFLATSKDIDTQIVPVALNYERGMIFRSSVLVSFSPPLSIHDAAELYRTEPVQAV